MTVRLFVTGTDTDIGKTLVSAVLMKEIASQGYTVSALKPVAAGSHTLEGREVNADAVELAKCCSQPHSPEQINPVLLSQPIAPHIAAAQQQQLLTVERCLAESAEQLLEPVDVLVIEGAGGWLVPLNDTETMADLACAFKARVILVVGMRLGCINHALLSAKAIAASGATLIGWVANTVNPHMPCFNENREAIRQRLNVPLLATLPYLPDGPEHLESTVFDWGLLQDQLKQNRA